MRSVTGWKISAKGWCRDMKAIGKAAATLLLTSTLLTLSVAAQKSPFGAQDREKERRSLAVNIVRAINTAEANFKQKYGSYASWDTLLSNGDFTNTGTKWAPESIPTVAHAMYGPGPEIVPGWKLRVTISKDGKAYDLQLEDVSDPKCRFAVSSDDRGLIRQGKSIDCPS
jgi:hypothetical protein